MSNPQPETAELWWDYGEFGVSLDFAELEQALDQTEGGVVFNRSEFVGEVYELIGSQAAQDVIALSLMDEDVLAEKQDAERLAIAAFNGLKEFDRQDPRRSRLAKFIQGNYPYLEDYYTSDWGYHVGAYEQLKDITDNTVGFMAEHDRSNPQFDFDVDIEPATQIRLPRELAFEILDSREDLSDLFTLNRSSLEVLDEYLDVQESRIWDNDYILSLCEELRAIADSVHDGEYSERARQWAKSAIATITSTGAHQRFWHGIASDAGLVDADINTYI